MNLGAVRDLIIGLRGSSAKICFGSPNPQRLIDFWS